MEFDIEKGPGEASSSSPLRIESRSRSENTGKGAANGRKSELEIFQTLVGIYFLEDGGARITQESNPGKFALQIHPASPFSDIFRPSKAAENRFRNRGLYDRALSQDMKNRLLYTMSHYIIVSLFIMQVLLSATITAIAAYHSASAVPLTVLGAINTVIAGLLAWVSGQGMPVRFRRARDQYREIVKAIEAAERMFAEIEYIQWPEHVRPHPVTERDRLEALFEEARLDQEQNYPEVQHNAQPAAVADREEKLQAKALRWRRPTA